MSQVPKRHPALLHCLHFSALNDGQRHLLVLPFRVADGVRNPVHYCLDHGMCAGVCTTYTALVERHSLGCGQHLERTPVDKVGRAEIHPQFAKHASRQGLTISSAKPRRSHENKSVKISCLDSRSTAAGRQHPHSTNRVDVSKPPPQLAPNVLLLC